MMDPGTGKLYRVVDEAEARRLGLIPVRRDLTPKERYEQQIRLYSPCACGSGKKFKFCCYRKSPWTTEQPISRAAQAILQRMIAAHDKEDFENAELVCEGGECWIGYHRTSRAVVNELLRAVLIRDAGEQDKRVERYSINEDGRKAATDPTWRPPEMRGIVR